MSREEKGDMVKEQEVKREGAANGAVPEKEVPGSAGSAEPKREVPGSAGSAEPKKEVPGSAGSAGAEREVPGSAGSAEPEKEVPGSAGSAGAEKKKHRLEDRVEKNPLLYGWISLMLLLILALLLPATAFCLQGFRFLVREKMLWMTEEEQEVTERKYTGGGDKTGDLFRIYVDEPLEAGQGVGASDEETVAQIAGYIFAWLTEADEDEIFEFCKNNGIRFSVYHHLGRRLFGTLPVEEERKAWKCRWAMYDGEFYQEQYWIRIKMEEGFSWGDAVDRFQTERFWIGNRYLVLIGAPVGVFFSCVLMILCIILAAARGKRSQTIFSRIPAEIVLIALTAALFLTGSQIRRDINAGWFEPVRIAGMSVLFCLIAVLLTVHFSRRLQRETWYQRTLLYLLFLCIRRLVLSWRRMLLSLAVTWKLFMVLMGISVFELLSILLLLKPGPRTYLLIGLWILEKLVMFPLVISYDAAIMKLQKAASEIASGNMDHKVGSDELPKVFQTFGNDMNAVAGSISAAVEDRLKSERMKTELITNVSHDIKTPLTSIINFADLIGKERTENPRISEYAEHLHEQSIRLKKLMDDLIEASKASTGSLEVHLEPCDIKILLGQCLGEFEPRLMEQGLELIIRQDEAPSQIMADNRLLWRVFENLMNNICKYAQKDTRVYLSTRTWGEEVQITIKNVSKYRLDIPAGELMERFVRGDLSRHTEGSGLGLSIASSLMELQGGRMILETDGDLFKVMLHFQAVKTG